MSANTEMFSAKGLDLEKPPVMSASEFAGGGATLASAQLNTTLDPHLAATLAFDELTA